MLQCGEREKAAFDRALQMGGRSRAASVIHELFAAWRANPNRRLTARVTFPLEWTGTGQSLRFNTIISPWNTMLDPYWIIDLHPADGGKWEKFGR